MSQSVVQVVKSLDEGKWKPFYLIVGEEPFQTTELLDRLKRFFLPDATAVTFNFEHFEGESLDIRALQEALDTMPGLFSEGPEARRLIVCTRFEKVPAASLERLDSYFRDPSSSTCFVMVAAKIDKRKAWIKAVDERGSIVEVTEPHDRDWPRWQAYFERKLGKKIETEAWHYLVESSNRTLSLLWSELEKISVFAADRPSITKQDLPDLAVDASMEDIFAFAEDVLCRRRFPAMRKFQSLLATGENEIKLLSILLRQFRMVDQCAGFLRRGISDGKVIGPQIGTAPFFVPKIIAQTKHHTMENLGSTFALLADCDFGLKTGEGGLFENFLVPYFALP